MSKATLSRPSLIANMTCRYWGILTRRCEERREWVGRGGGEGGTCRDDTNSIHADRSIHKFSSCFLCFVLPLEMSSEKEWVRRGGNGMPRSIPAILVILTHCAIFTL
jgi:hypothetical protein